MTNFYQKGELKKSLPEMKSGDTVKVYEKIPDEKKKKSQIFEGVLIAKKHGEGINGTFTIRRIIDGVGVEKVYPYHSPLVEKIEVIKKGKARRSKLYYLREESEKKVRRKLRSVAVRVDPKEKTNKEKDKEKDKTKEIEKNKKKDKEIVKGDKNTEEKSNSSSKKQTKKEDKVEKIEKESKEKGEKKEKK